MLFHSTLRRRRNVSDQDCRENQNTFYGQYTFPENRAVCAITCKNDEKLEKLLMKIYYGACSLHAGYLRYSHTLICNTYCFFTSAVATGTHLNVTFIRTLPVLFCFHSLHGLRYSRHGSDGTIEIVFLTTKFIIIIIIITIPIKLHVISKIFKAEETVK
jgi:hypothetical protein